MKMQCPYCRMVWNAPDGSTIVNCPRCSNAVSFKKQSGSTSGPLGIIARLPKPIKYVLVFVLLAIIIIVLLSFFQLLPKI